jgi:hypothetical protein
MGKRVSSPLMTPTAHIFVVIRQISFVVSSTAFSRRRSEDVIKGMRLVIWEVCVVAQSLKIGEAHCDEYMRNVPALGMAVACNKYGVSITRS